MRFSCLASIVWTILIAAVPAGAQPYPVRPIKLLVPFPAGGPVDVMARLVAQQLSASFAQVIVENRPGGSSTLAAKAAVAAEPDGYTLLLSSAATLAIAPALIKEPGYDPDAFVPVAFVSSVPYVMIAGPTTAFKSVAEVIAYAKANPGRLNFGAPSGAPPQMLIGWFKSLTGADITLVPYKGASTVLSDLVGGQIHGGFETVSVVLANLNDGKMRALAVANPTRLPDLPEIPTLIESGVDAFVASSWTGISAPAGTPREIVERLNRAINKGLADPAMRTSMQRLGALTQPGTPEDFAAFIAAERPKWAGMARLSGEPPQ